MSVKPSDDRTAVDNEHAPRHTTTFDPIQFETLCGMSEIVARIKDGAELRGSLDPVAAHGSARTSVTSLAD